MSFNIRGEKVEFYIYEKQSYFEHIISPEEIKKQEKYEKEVKRDRRSQKPYIPSNDYLFNGKLLFSTKKVTYIHDTDEIQIEDRLSDMLIQLVQQSEIVKTERSEREEAQRIRDEKIRQRELFVESYNNEIDKLTLLLKESNDFETATKIRDYIYYVQQGDFRHKKTAWISWAKEKADWYDPTVPKNDRVFGVRKHNSNAIPQKIK